MAVSRFVDGRILYQYTFFGANEGKRAFGCRMGLWFSYLILPSCRTFSPRSNDDGILNLHLQFIFENYSSTVHMDCFPAPRSF
jgi:hypothetical protein